MLYTLIPHHKVKLIESNKMKISKSHLLKKFLSETFRIYNTAKNIFFYRYIADIECFTLKPLSWSNVKHPPILELNENLRVFTIDFKWKHEKLLRFSWIASSIINEILFYWKILLINDFPVLRISLFSLQFNVWEFCSFEFCCGVKYFWGYFNELIIPKLCHNLTTEILSSN